MKKNKLKRSVISEYKCSLEYILKSPLGISPKNIKDWEGKGLITPEREPNSNNWRVFDFFDILSLLVISDVRKFGLEIPKLQNTLNNIYAYYGIKHLEKRDFSKICIKMLGDYNQPKDPFAGIFLVDNNGVAVKYNNWVENSGIIINWLKYMEKTVEFFKDVKLKK